MYQLSICIEIVTTFSWWNSFTTKRTKESNVWFDRKQMRWLWKILISLFGIFTMQLQMETILHILCKHNIIFLNAVKIQTKHIYWLFYTFIFVSNCFKGTYKRWPMSKLRIGNLILSIWPRCGLIKSFHWDKSENWSSIETPRTTLPKLSKWHIVQPI